MSYTSSGTPIHLVCSVCGKSLQGAFYQIGERYLCPQCIGVSQAFQPAVFNPSVPMPDYSSDWLAENIRLRAENETLKAQFAELEAINARQAETVAMLKRVAPPLPRLWVSSTDLLARFEANPTIKQAVDRMMSEVAEFIGATSQRNIPNTEIAKEAADVWVTVINVLRAANVSDAVFYEGLETVMESNDKKTDKTHQRSAQNGVERLPKVVNHE